MPYLFSNLNPALKTDGPETLMTVAAYMPLSKKQKYEGSFAGKVVSVIPVVALAKAIFGKKGKYGDGEKVLGERFLDHVQGLNVGRRDVPDEVVDAARVFFTISFGVRITIADDLDALDTSAEKYYARPDKGDIPRIAVDRAVKLKKTYFPASSYNTGQWDLTRFQNFPLVAPVPGLEFMTYMNGSVPGIGPIVNGIPINPTEEEPPIKSPVNDPKAATLPSKSSLDTPTGAGSSPQAEQGLLDNPVILYSLLGLGVIIVIAGTYYVMKK